MTPSFEGEQSSAGKMKVAAHRSLIARHRENGLDPIRGLMTWNLERTTKAAVLCCSHDALRERRGNCFPTVSMDEHKHVYVAPSLELSRKREELAPEIERAFQSFSRAVFAPGALDTKTKQLIAVAAAHVTQCPYCIRGHTKAALRAGALDTELMEAIWVASEMRAGAAYAHSVIALDVMKQRP